MALKPDEVGPGNLEAQQTGNGREPVDSGAGDQEGGPKEAEKHSSGSRRDESSDMDEDQMSGPSNAEPQVSKFSGVPASGFSGLQEQRRMLVFKFLRNEKEFSGKQLLVSNQ